LNAQGKLLSQQAGKLVTFELNSQIANLTAKVGSNQITQAVVTLRASGKATDLKQFNLSEYSLQLAQLNQQLLTLSARAPMIPKARLPTWQMTMQAFLARLLQAFPQPDVNVSSGTASLKAHVVQKGDTQSVNGNFALADFTGKFGTSELQSFGVNADIDIANTPQSFRSIKPLEH